MTYFFCRVMMHRIANVACSLLLLAGVLVFVDTLKMKITRELKAPMHIHEFNLNEAADKIYAVGHDKLVRFDMQA